MNNLVETLESASAIGCGKCTYDEAEGGLVDHCDECCRRFITKLYQELPALVSAVLIAESLGNLVNSPETANFLEGVKLEAAHQVERWGTADDRAKRPADWFWLIGYLAGKALHAQVNGDQQKALHHTISTAAALRNWHAAIIAGESAMAPGSSDVEKIVEQSFPGHTT